MNEGYRPEWRRVAGALAAGCALLLLWMFDWVDWDTVLRWAQWEAPRLLALAAALIFLGIGVWCWLPKLTPAPGLTWRAVAAAAAVVAAVAWGATNILLAEADTTPVDGRGAVRVDAIKTGLGIGAGATGIFALLLAVRRQTHQEHTAADSSFDAAERRVTELYTKAVEQLGSAKAAVRLGGLYALDRLGQNHEKQRETILNVICAYLRMPYSAPEALPNDATPGQHDRFEDRVQEAQVRLTAQRILYRRRANFAQLWTTESGIDLTNANLGRAKLAFIFLEGAELSGANLSGANLGGAHLTGADLTDAKLTGAYLPGAYLNGAHILRADLTDSRLTGANLNGANLTDAYLNGAYLNGSYLTSANLTGADLTGTYLNGAYLNGADLTDAKLANAKLTRADLTNARLARADLTDAYLNGADLTNAKLANAKLTRANLAGARLGGADLTDANLTDANLTNAHLNGANLTNTILPSDFELESTEE